MKPTKLKGTNSLQLIKYLQNTSRWLINSGQPFSIEQFVYNNGFSFAGMVELKRNGKPKECFCNAARMVMADPKLIYCEGYALDIIPVLHGWVMDHAGNIIETTWAKPGKAYYGVPFQKKYLFKALQENKHYGLIDRWETDFQLVRGNVPVLEFKWTA